MRISPPFIQRDKKHLFAGSTLISPIDRTGVIDSHLLSASRIRAVFSKGALAQAFNFTLESFYFLRKILNRFDSLGQTKPHFEITPYPHERGDKFQVFHIGAPFACVDRSVGGMEALWRTVSFFLSHSRDSGHMQTRKIG